MSAFLAKIGGGLWSVLALVLAILAAAGSVFAIGRRSKGAEDARDQAVARERAAEQQLEMHRDATAIEKQVGKLTAEQVDQELGKWDRKQ